MKKDSILMNFIKGLIIGLGIIFPISASALAVSMGVYERLINVINNLKKEFKKEAHFFIPFVIGVGVSILISCVLVNFTYKKYPIATLLFFEGLIIGGFPLIFKKTNKEYKFSNIIWTVVGVIALIAISLINGGENVSISYSAMELLTLFGVGFLSGFVMIIPGVSGSLILVILGYYEALLDLISKIVHFENLGQNFLMAFVFGIAVLLGIAVVSKLMDYFLTKHERKSYFAIVGFIIASIVNVFVLIFGYSCSIVELIIGLVLLVIGFVISFKYLKEE